MAKKVFMIAPFDVLTGNLSGEQKLQYAENNNPAYEAPNGTQYARNYHTRYIAARRGRDGLAYFQVKKATATVLNADTRMTMATLAGVAAIRSALMKNHAQDYAQIIANLAIDVAHGIISGTGKRTVMSLFYEKVADMLQGHKPTVVFSGSTSVTINNPWNVDSSNVFAINPVVWLKYAPIFAFSDNNIGGYYFTIAGRKYFAMWTQTPHTDTDGPTWGAWYSSLAGNFNAREAMDFFDGSAGEAGIKVEESDVTVGGVNVKYNGTNVNGRTDKVIVNGKYTL